MTISSVPRMGGYRANVLGKRDPETATEGAG
jgi:hypothetical protein